MPFIKQSTLDTLRSDARNGADVKRLEKLYEKQIRTIRREHAEELEDTTDELSLEIRTLERKLSKSNNAVKEAVAEAKEAHTESIAQVKADYLKKEAELSDSNNSLIKQVTVLKERVASEEKLLSRELDLADAEDELKRSAEFLANREKDFDAKVKAFDKRAKDEDELQYAKGYTDGVTDTLRESADRVSEVQRDVVDLAKTALNKDVTVITTTQTPTKSK